MKAPLIRVGCSGWYYRHWKDRVYPAGLPSHEWLTHYQRTFDTVELNAPFYHWPQAATIQNWARQANPGFQYSIKANRRITHLKRFSGTKRLVREFCHIAEVLEEHMGCFLFQLPPTFHYTATRLRAMVQQLDPEHRNVVEFRHASWWNPVVFQAFHEAGVIFCSVSAPSLSEDLIQTTDVLYVRLHGAARWYRHDYSDAELREWAKRLRAIRAREIWVYFNNDFDGCAFRNGQTLKRLLQ